MASAFTSIITTLETLKTEAAEIARKVEETDAVMAEVETVSQQYVPLAQSCSSIYFTLESLNQVQHRGTVSHTTGGNPTPHKPDQLSMYLDNISKNKFFVVRYTLSHNFKTYQGSVS